MNFQDPRFWLDLFIVGLTGLNTAVVWLRRPGQEAKAAIQQLSDRFDEELRVLRESTAAAQNSLSGRMQSVEERLQHIPTDDELATLRGDVQRVEAQVEGLGQLLSRMEHQQTLILQQILNRP